MVQKKREFCVREDIRRICYISRGGTHERKKRVSIRLERDANTSLLQFTLYCETRNILSLRGLGSRLLYSKTFPFSKYIYLKENDRH